MMLMATVAFGIHKIPLRHLVGQSRMRRCADIDMRRCPRCGGVQVKIIAAILERAVIGKILTHLGLDPQPPPRSKAREAGLEFAA